MPGTARETIPVGPVFNKPFTSEEMMRLVVEAVVAVSIVVEAYGNCEAAAVDEEKKTPCVRIEVVVAAVEVPKELVLINGYANMEAEVR